MAGAVRERRVSRAAGVARVLGVQLAAPIGGVVRRGERERERKNLDSRTQKPEREGGSLIAAPTELSQLDQIERLRHYSLEVSLIFSINPADGEGAGAAAFLRLRVVDVCVSVTDLSASPSSQE